MRSCDGYYFPISFSTIPNKFADDQRTCQRECPATDAQLYTYRNPGEDINQAVSIGGQPYTALPAAFQYRKEFNAACSCRKPGQSWADALKNADDSTTLESGDIVVTDQNAKALSQPPQPTPPKGTKPPKPGATAAAPGSTPAAVAAMPVATPPTPAPFRPRRKARCARSDRPSWRTEIPTRLNPKAPRDQKLARPALAATGLLPGAERAAGNSVPGSRNLLVIG